MASHGAMKEAATLEAPRSKAPKVGKFHHMEIVGGQNGGASAQHFHEHPDGYGHRPHGEPYVFGADEGHKLAAHIEKHLGIRIPGRAEGTSAEMRKTDAEEEDE